MEHDVTPIDPEKLTGLLSGTEQVYSGVRVDVHRLKVKCPSGREAVREVIAHPGAVVMVPVMDNGDIVLIRNQRVAVGERLWELPAGTLEPDERPEATAKRELEEETGYRPSVIDPLTNFYSSPGFSNEVLYGYACKGLQLFEQSLDEGEDIQVEVHPWEAVIQMVGNGVIRDAKSIAALLYYGQFVRNAS